MGQKEKLIKKLKSVPKDMTFEEVETLLRYLTFQQRENQRFARLIFQRLSPADLAA